MWALNIKFDARFFAIAFCMLLFMQISIILFFANGIRDLAQYWSAQKRIKVSNDNPWL
jgi:hypothetical protein